MCDYNVTTLHRSECTVSCIVLECRKYDYENYLSTLLLPKVSSQAATFVLRAFYIELAQVDIICFLNISIDGMPLHTT